jgi:hypothetical protein
MLLTFVAQVKSSLVGQPSQVQSVADYAKLSPASDKPILLTPKEVHPCYATALCIKTDSAT